MPNSFELRPPLTSIAADHCSLPFSPLPCATVNATELPYHDLGGRGFERLCYELLLKEQPSRPPRFFGVSGQNDYAVDLIADEPEGSVVYQCKNLKHPLKDADVSKILNLFKTEWLDNPSINLPKPIRFVLCCPQNFSTPSKVRDHWEVQTSDFFNQTGIKLSIWQLDDLDSRLRKAPDIVADLFSDTLAHAFCDNPDDWKPDIFWPIKDGASLPAVLRRYQQRQEKGSLYYDTAYQKDFNNILDRERVVLIQGLPASGKTLMATAFARAFQDGQWRVYYLNVAESGACAEAILTGIRLRLSRPTLILLDNVDSKQTVVQTVFDRLQGDLNNKPLGLILLARHIAAEAEERGDDWELREQLQERQAVLNFVNNPERFAKLVTTLRPDFAGLKPTRMKKLAALTGRDFLLLDDTLATLTSPEEIDTLDAQHLLTRVKKHYFGTGSVHLPTITRLAALAQFDLNPLAVHFDDQWQAGEQVRCQSLMVLIAQPARYQFLHSSLAELIFHALTNKATGKHASFSIMEQTLLAHLQQDGVELGEDLLKVLRAPLPLLGREKARVFKASLLENTELQDMIFGLGFEQARLAVMFSSVRLLRLIESPCVAQFTEKLAAALQQWINQADEYPDVFRQWRYAINVLRQADEVTAMALEKQISPLLLLYLLENDGTVVQLFRWVKKTSPDATHELIALLDLDKVSKLVDNTIASARSIATLDLALFELRKTAADVGLALEQAIGAAQLLKLIESNGTVFELFRFAQHLNTETARELIALLNDDRVRKLVTKTITNGRSIGTLDLTLHELRKTAPDIGLALERAIGAAQLLKLIENNGTVFELFKFSVRLNLETAHELIALLDDDKVGKLVNKTISAQRSIGTLSFTLKNLKQRAPNTGKALEAKLGAARFWRLLSTLGNPKTLADLTESMSASCSTAVLAQARHSDGACWNALFKRGSLFEAADFIARCPAWLEDATLQPLITASLQQHAERLVNDSDWYGLDTAALKLAQATNRQVCDPLHKALQQRWSCCSIDTLSFTDFAEAVHALSCLTREIPSNKLLIAQQLWRLLPPPANWAKTSDTFMYHARILFSTMADSAFSAADAKTVLEVGMAVDKTALLTKASTQDVMLYWWSLYSLWFAYCPASGTLFARMIPTEALQSLQKLVENRAKQQLNRDENLFLLALVGLLFFLDSPPSKSCLKALISKFAKQRQLEANLLKQSFVPAYFGLHGLQKLFPTSPIHPLVNMQLQALVKQYPNPTAAVVALCATLNKAKGRVDRKGKS